MARIEFRNVTKTFAGDVRAVDDLSLTVEDGEFMVLLGPSGCGKSTLLRLLAGLETATDGAILLNGNRINEQTPQARDVAMVFQNYALYPHKTVRENLAFPLRMMKQSKEERENRITRAADMLGLTPYLNRKPGQLSGGQSQRVAMGRAIVRDPSAFLMDEPLSNLDAKLRTQVRAEIADLQRKLGVTTLYVTHDQVEAMTLGQRIALLKEGRLQQVDSAQRIFTHPANTFVATFVGNPGMNLLRCHLALSENHRFQLSWGEARLNLPAEITDARLGLRRLEGGPVILGIRPEAFRLEDQTGETQSFVATARTVEALGHEKLVYLDPPGELAGERPEAGPGNTDARQDTSLVARLPASLSVQSGEELRLHVDATQFHFFTARGDAVPEPD